jgi:hypothetical protein
LSGKDLTSLPKANSSSAGIVNDWSARIAVAPLSDFPKLVRALLAEPPSGARDRNLAALLSRWIVTNPQSFRSFLDAIGADDDDDFPARFFAALPSALPYLSDRAAGSPYLAELVAQLIDQTAEENPQKALQWADQWLLGDSLEQARVTIAGALAKNSTEDALKVLEKIQNPLRRVQALAAIGEGFAERDPKKAAAWAQQLPHDTEVAMAMNSVLSVMAENDPTGAATTFRDMQSHIAEKYGRLVAADRKRRGLPEKPQLDEQGNEIVNDAGGEDAIPSENPDFNLLEDASMTIAHELAGQDPQAALGWADSLPSILKSPAKRAALSAWAESEPEAAYQYCVNGHWNDAETYGNIFSSWAVASPEAAAQEATRVTTPSLRKEALSNVVSTWADQDKEAVGQWIGQLPSQQDRDTANLALAEAVDVDRPQEAWDRATKISSPEVRHDALNSAFASLVAQAPDKARLALNQASNLTIDERSSLTRMLQSQDVVKKN